ncbi:hypothetical protein EVAR_41979_1 [Eumeta japonica]|uniref:Uncharacterized protein n=1 Tax=Eumeta variegata TaxID=151549 RepID=A0A4C1WKU2_EUMVA|nr:hypothetical protein EVAR_41979_1 [Eumeta japonica]
MIRWIKFRDCVREFQWRFRALRCLAGLAVNHTARDRLYELATAAPPASARALHSTREVPGTPACIHFTATQSSHFKTTILDPTLSILVNYRGDHVHDGFHLTRNTKLEDGASSANAN